MKKIGKRNVCQNKKIRSAIVWALFVFLIFPLASACSLFKTPYIPRQPTLQPFADGKYWVLYKSLEYMIPNTDEAIVIPKGFVTDLASIPDFIENLKDILGITKYGAHIRAAIIHDYLYWNQSCGRKQSDKLFYFAMRDSGLDYIEAIAFWNAVDKLGGEDAWKKNYEKKSQGYVKVIPEVYQEIPVNKTWGAYKKELKQAGVQDGDSGNNFSKVCAMMD